MVKINSKDTVCERISFLSNGLTLKGILHLPPIAAPPTVIGAHGLFSNCESPKQVALAKRCTEHGIAFFRFDHRGCGDSQGNFSRETSLASRVCDLDCAIDLIQNHPDTGTKIGLFGSSMGGSVCLTLAPSRDIRAMVIVAAPLDSDSVNIDLTPAANGLLPGDGLDKNSFHFDISEHIAGIHNCLIFHGENDHVVAVSHARRLYRCVKGNKKLVIQKCGDHRMSDATHQQAFIRQATAWLVQHLK